MPFDDQYDPAPPAGRLQFALQAAQVGTWDLDLPSQQVWWDERCKELYGFHQEDIVPYDQVLAYIHPDDVQRVDQAVRSALNPHSAGHYDVQFRTVGASDVRLRWLHCQGRAFFDEQGVAYRFSGIAQDVTPLFQTHQQLDSSEAQFQNLVMTNPAATAVFTGRDMQIQQANAPMLAIWGKDASVIGKTVHVAMPELEGQPFLVQLQQVFDTGEPFRHLESAAEVIEDGQRKRVWFNHAYNPLYDQDNRIYGVINTATDITPQVLARQKLAESEARFRSLVEEAPVATCLFVGLDLVMEIINQPMLDIFAKGDHLRSMTLTDAVPELASQPFPELLRQVIRTGQTYEAFGAKAELIKNGQRGTYYFDFTYKPLRNAANEVYAVLDMAIDVTEQVVARQKIKGSEERYRTLAAELEQQIRQRTQELDIANQRLATANKELANTNDELTTSNEALLTSNQHSVAVNTELAESNHDLTRSNDNLEKFAYIASHDLQEPLRKIQSFGDILKTQYAEQLGDGVLYLERMQSAANRMSTLIKDLLTFSRISTRQETVTPVPLRDVVDTVLGDLELRIQETGAIVDVDPLPVVSGDRSQLEQLFQNLLSNALKFRRAGVSPVIRISSQAVQAVDLPATVRPARWAGLYHRIEVTDNGVGFDNKYVDRIFQVFQRLHGKGEYAGTGIGLAICEKVVANHGGAITARSQPGQGATFQVYLPV